MIALTWNALLHVAAGSFLFGLSTAIGTLSFIVNTEESKNRNSCVFRLIAYGILMAAVYLIATGLSGTY